jgi:hypothetical protein
MGQNAMQGHSLPKGHLLYKEVTDPRALHLTLLHHIWVEQKNEYMYILLPSAAQEEHFFGVGLMYDLNECQNHLKAS